MQIGKEIVNLFARDVRGLGDLPREAADYWLNTSKLDECGGEDGIPDAAMERLCAMHEFLTGGDAEGLSADDWAELSGMVDDESEELPVDVLTGFMSVLLEHGALD